MRVAVLVILYLAQPGLPRYVGEVEAALAADDELARHHRGYIAYLQRHDAMAAAEASVNELRRRPRFAAAVGRLEEFLIAQPEARREYLQYLEALRGNRELTEAVEDIERARNRFVFLDDPLAYFRANPSAAVEFFRAPSLTPELPESLLPYLNEFSRNSDLRSTLLDAFSELTADSPAAGAVRAWWGRTQGEQAEGREAIMAMEDYFRDHGGHYKSWQDRNLALAADAHASEWILYWHARVRRNEVLAAGYYDYLSYVSAQSSSSDAGFQPGQQEYAPLPWPPEGSPPGLAPWEPPLAAPTLFRPARPSVHYPRAPRVTRPPFPTMPNEPLAPTVPRVPEPFVPVR